MKKQMRNRKRIIGMTVSAVVMITLMIWIYCSEFTVSPRMSDHGLERAIREWSEPQHWYGKDPDVDEQGDAVCARVLETRFLYDHMYVFYRQSHHPSACGLVILKQGPVGRYRITKMQNEAGPLIHAETDTVRQQRYAVVYGVNDLPDVGSYEVYGQEVLRSTKDVDTIGEKHRKVFTRNYTGAPFLLVRKIPEAMEGMSYDLFDGDVKYISRKTGKKISPSKLEKQIGTDEKALDYTAASMEPGVVYLWEGIILVLGIIFIRYFAKMKKYV